MMHHIGKQKQWILIAAVFAILGGLIIWKAQVSDPQSDQTTNTTTVAQTAESGTEMIVLKKGQTVTIPRFNVSVVLSDVQLECATTVPTQQTGNGTTQPAPPCPQHRGQATLQVITVPTPGTATEENTNTAPIVPKQEEVVITSVPGQQQAAGYVFQAVEYNNEQLRFIVHSGSAADAVNTSDQSETNEQ